MLSRENSKHKSPRWECTWYLKKLFQAPGLHTSSEGCFLKLIKFIFHNICPFKVYKSVLFSTYTKLFYFFKVMICFGSGQDGIWVTRFTFLPEITKKQTKYMKLDFQTSDNRQQRTVTLGGWDKKEGTCECPAHCPEHCQAAVLRAEAQG